MSSIMWITRSAAVALLVTMTGLPALAQPIEIATLGRAPVMGTSTSASELKTNFNQNQGLMRQAAAGIGLTTEQYEQFRLALEVGKPNWVTVPRHLDAMTWASGGRVHVLHDVIIPAGQKGIEYDIRTPDKIVAIFLPAKCGNLSVIRRNVPRVAAVRNFPVPHVAAVAAPPPISIPAAAHHGIGLLPLAALVPFLFHSSSSSNIIPGIPTPGTGTVVSLIHISEPTRQAEI